MKREKVVLFVCSGNVFRSLSAQEALRLALAEAGRSEGIMVESAGVVDHSVFGRAPHQVTLNCLQSYGVDASGHRSRLLTQGIVDGANLVVAMGTDHQEVIERQFGLKVPLYLGLVTGHAAHLDDLCEAVPDYRKNRPGAVGYVTRTIGQIFDRRDALCAAVLAHLRGSPSPATASRPAPEPRGGASGTSPYCAPVA